MLRNCRLLINETEGQIDNFSFRIEYCLFHFMRAYNEHSYVKLFIFLLYLLVRCLPHPYDYDSRCEEHLHNKAITDIPAPLFHSFSSTVPYVADAVAYWDHGFTLFVVLNMLVYPPSCLHYSSGEYTVLFKDRSYYGTKMAGGPCLVMKYSLPISGALVGDSIEFTIQNSAMNHTIPKCSAVVLSSKKKGGIASCSYLSGFNSLVEVIHFISYTLSIGVDEVILYEATPIPYKDTLKLLFGKRAHFFSFMWPQRSNFPYPQRGSQRAQMNSCYYRNKYYYEYMIFIDVDEYLFFAGNSTLKSVLDDALHADKDYGIQVSSIAAS